MTLADAHKSIMRATHTAAFDQAAAVWRSPAAVGGKVGPIAQAASGVACKLWPAAQAPRLAAAVPDLGGARYSHVAFFLDTADVRAGDELRIGSGKYKVISMGVWTVLRVAALELLA